MRLSSIFIGLMFCTLSMSSFAQTPQATPTRIRGTVAALDGQALTVLSREGDRVTLELMPNFVVRSLEKRQLSDIKEGDYVASAGVRGVDGKLHALEVRIFPEALRGRAEGQFAWDLLPESTMTNATVVGTSKASTGTTLKVVFKGGESEYVVGPDTPVMTYGTGDASLLKPGAVVVVFALKHADGKLTADSIAAESNGLKPPM